MAAFFSRACVALLYLFFLSYTLCAETFRVHKLFRVNLPGDDASEQLITVGINDSVAVFLPQDTTFLDGIELNIHIPPEVADWRDSVAFSVYNGIKPTPDTSQIDYSGARMYVVPLPSKLSWIVQVPIKEKSLQKVSSYISKVDGVPDFSNGYTFFRFQPAMKGVPDSTLEAKLGVSVKPILQNKGRVVLSVVDSEQTPHDFELYVDDTPAVLDGNSIILTSGAHNFSVVSPEFRNEVRTVYVEQAKTSAVNIVLKSLAPTLKITAPDNAEVFLDDAKVKATGEEFVVTEGEHKVRFLMGGYEVIRSLVIEKGKSYNANLVVDLEISEE